jgi:hypothetical protein
VQAASTARAATAIRIFFMVISECCALRNGRSEPKVDASRAFPFHPPL